MASVYRYLQRLSHESPVIVWALGLGFLGPALVVTVPPIRKSLGWQPAERIPTTFPLPDRARRPVSGFEDPKN
ncbi:n19m, NADH-ubiquinone oxidoreductase 9.5 kDa subunit [Vanrija albida]|uniref:N19m, NADH-ubiquinone oxidoreductase 9.5 kDa subunit n=1 Tax=Vanrija albida TaxID=181172 RepID=A0ABR3Q1S9_9TREE